MGKSVKKLEKSGLLHNWPANMAFPMLSPVTFALGSGILFFAAAPSFSIEHRLEALVTATLALVILLFSARLKPANQSIVLMSAWNAACLFYTYLSPPLAAHLNLTHIPFVYGAVAWKFSKHGAAKRAGVINCSLALMLFLIQRYFEHGVSGPADQYLLRESLTYDLLYGAFSSTFLFTLIQEVARKYEEKTQNLELAKWIIDEAPAPLFCKDSQDEFRFVHWNRAAEKLWGLPADKILGKNDFDFFPEAESQAFRAKDQEVLNQGGEVLIEEEPITLPTSEVRLLRTRKVPVLNRYLLGISEDITERVSYQRNLISKNAELRALFESMVEGILIVKTDQTLLHCNQAAVEILGKTLPEMVDSNGKLQIPTRYGEDGAEITPDRSPTLRALMTGKPQRNQVMKFFKPHTNQETWISVSVAPIMEGDSAPTKIIVSFQDITDLKKAQLNLTNAAKMSSLGEMSAGLAHEINNPLLIIKGLAFEATDILGDPNPDLNAIGHACKKIDQTVDRIAKIVAGLRSFSRQGTQDPPSTVSLRNVLDETLSYCQARFQHAGVKLEVADIPDAWVIRCQPTQISQALLNILNNAHDAVAELSEKWVKISVEATPTAYRVIIEDSGRGIPEAVREKLFQPFFTTKPIGTGTGLGLSISHGIAAAHGGKLSIDSQSTQTRFVLEIPHSGQSNKGHVA